MPYGWNNQIFFHGSTWQKTKNPELKESSDDAAKKEKMNNQNGFVLFMNIRKLVESGCITFIVLI